MSTDAQQQSELSQQFIKDNNKNIQNITKGYITSNNKKSSNNISVTSSTETATTNTGTTIMKTVNATFSFIFLLIIPLILLHTFKKHKENSKIAKGFYYYFKLAIVSCILFYIGSLLNIFIPSFFKYYIPCVIVGIIIYVYSKITKKGFSKENKRKISANIENGVVLGAINGRVIVKPAQESGHVLVNGGSGLGKSQCVSIPTILNWAGSSLIIDIKRELYAYTNKVQRSKGKVIVFDPEQNGHCYNPIRECTTVDSCLFLARAIIPTPENSSSDPFWTTNAQNVLAASCFEGNREGKTLPEIAERILMTESETLVQELLNSKYREVTLLGGSLRGTPDKTLGGIFAELKSKLILFATDANIIKALSKSDWTPETLEEGVTIYLRVSERQIETYKPVWNVIIVQVFRYLSGRAEQKNPPILLLLDEFARLKKVEGYNVSLPTLRSKNVTILTAIQSLGQLQGYYGKEITRTIMDNKSYKLVLGAGDPETQKYFSDLAGKDEVKKKSANYNLGGAGMSEYKQWEERFRPENFGHLEKPILYTPDKPAFQVEKVFWMNMPYFSKLQKKYGGPTTFIPKGDLERLAFFNRDNEDQPLDISNNDFSDEVKNELIKEKTIEINHKVTAFNDDFDGETETDDVGDETGYISKLQKWQIK